MCENRNQNHILPSYVHTSVHHMKQTKTIP
uniref:Uncharacterized protein n=1 Tax=Arundo donax TaxID=35708 RepID=A0A0A8Y550_ARUDO